MVITVRGPRGRVRSKHRFGKGLVVIRKFRLLGRRFKIFLQLGWSLNLCSDVDECRNAPCDEEQDCFNTAGSYKCVQKGKQSKIIYLTLQVTLHHPTNIAWLLKPTLQTRILWAIVT